MSESQTGWLECLRGNAPLVVSLPHTGSEIPHDVAAGLISPWLARKDTDWHVERIYKCAAALGATVVRTRVSRSVIDVNRDPSGASLYPGQATTELCPTTTFDGEPLYQPGQEPPPDVIERRLAAWFDPYHAALAAEVARLRALHPRVVVYDCHAIRSVIPRLFAGVLPHFNFGTNEGRSCDRALTAAVEAAIDPASFTRVTDGRFRGGFITRSLGRPDVGVHALQMELAMRTYLAEPAVPLNEANWPPEYDPALAEPARLILARVLEACLEFTREEPSRGPLKSPPARSQS